MTATQTRASRPGSVSTTAATKRLSTQAPATRRVSPGESSNASGDKHADTPSPGSKSGTGTPRSDAAPVRGTTSNAATPQRIMTGTASAKEVEDLKTKLRLVEKKRQEDREKLKELEQAEADRDKYEAIIQKLQAKYQPQQQEITELRKKLKENEEAMSKLESDLAEHETGLEMATLDREMAEETAEAFKSELETIRLKNEELELEVEVLRAENEEFSQVMSPEEKSSHGWLQMEKSNERLKEALIRLRDLTQQTESDLREQIKEMEDEVEDYRKTKDELVMVKDKLQITENNFENIKEQLNDALGAEEMIEELSAKNDAQKDLIDDLRISVEELESLQELNDELEQNHVVAEKELQDEVDFQKSVVRDQVKKVAQQNETIEDLEYTLSKFRELVQTLQSDLEDMRASQQITETEANELTNRSKAMMDLNLKLQASASKTQLKTIDMELGRLNAQEAMDHLEMVKLFLPDTFSVEKDPILAFLRFKRVTFKSTLVASIVRDRISDQISLGVYDHIFTSYEILEELTWVSATCDKFVNFIKACSVEDFAKMEEALYELEPVERALNVYIDGLRKNELDEKRCAAELSRSMALLSHLSEKLIPATLESYADDIHMRAVMMQNYLENTAAALTQISAIVQSKATTTPEDKDEIEFFGQKLDSLSSQARSGKVVVGKVARALEDLKTRSLSLPEDTFSSFETSEQAAKRLADLSKNIGDDVVQKVGEEGRTEPLTYHDFLGCMVRNLSSNGTSNEAESNDAIIIFTNGLKDLSTQLEELTNLAGDLSITTEFERRTAPWIERAQHLERNKVIPPDADEEIRRLKTEAHETAATLVAKSQTLEEQSIKIEHLESRMREASKKAASVKDLETLLEQARTKETELVARFETQSADYNTLMDELTDYKSRIDQMKRTSVRIAASGTNNAATIGTMSMADHLAAMASAHELETLRTEIRTLQAAIRFLQAENRRLRLLDSTSVETSAGLKSWLDQPLAKQRRSAKTAEASAAAAEASSVLDNLLTLTSSTKLLDLTKTIPSDLKACMAWRPVKETSRYQALRNREQFERWTEQRDAVLRGEKERAKQKGRVEERLRGGADGEKGDAPRVRRGAEVEREVLVSRAWKMWGLPGDVSKGFVEDGFGAGIRVVE